MLKKNIIEFHYQPRENKLENDKACNLMREELTAIKQWKKETYGE